MTIGLQIAFSFCLVAWPSPASEMAGAVQTAYESNRASIPFGTVRATVAVGQAADLKAAMEGRWKYRAVADCRYVFDGPKGYFELIHTLEDMVRYRSVDSKVSQTSLLYSTKVLTDGRVTMYDNIAPDIPGNKLMYTSQITQGTEVFFRAMDFMPINLGDPSPRFGLGTEIGRTLHRTPDYALESVEENATDLGRSLVRLTLKVRETTNDYWVDLEHGALPVQEKVRLGDGLGEILIVSEDVRGVANRAWLPFRRRTFIVQPRTTSVRDFAIQEADFNARPHESAFRLELPEPSAMVDQVRNATYAPQKVWDLSKLPTPGSRSYKRWGPVVHFPTVAPEMPGEIYPNRWVVPLMVLGCLLLLASIAVLIQRRRHA
jgi:hypothetical protein